MSLLYDVVDVAALERAVSVSDARLSKSRRPVETAAEDPEVADVDDDAAGSCREEPACTCFDGEGALSDLSTVYLDMAPALVSLPVVFLADATVRW